jgi:hypothetical protein
MHWSNLAIVTLLVGMAAVLMFENFEMVTVSLLDFKVRLPMPVLITGIYAAGAVTGGSLVVFARRSYDGRVRRTRSRELVRKLGLSSWQSGAGSSLPGVHTHGCSGSVWEVEERRRDPQP